MNVLIAYHWVDLSSCYSNEKKRSESCFFPYYHIFVQTPLFIFLECYFIMCNITIARVNTNSAKEDIIVNLTV